ncbi:MAG: tetratricopeptide repeat protein, partial [bacterium]
ILSSLSSFGYQLGLFFFPWGREVFHYHPAEFVRFNGWLVIGLIYLFVPIFFLKVKRHPVFILGWLWSIVVLLPVSVLSSFGPSGRLLYLPAMGWLVMSVVLINLISTRTAWRRFLLVFLGCWLALSVPFLYQRMRTWRNEESLFYRMVAEAPDYAPGYYNLSAILLNKGDDSGAIVLLKRAVALDSSLSVASFNLAALLQKRGEYREAEVLLRRVIKDKPDYAQGYANLALILLGKGDLVGAIELEKKGCELAPDDPNLFYNLALLFHQDGKLDSAREAVEKAVQLAPGNPRFQALLKKLQ